MSTSFCAAITAAPERTSPICPSRERVPSGKISRFQRSWISLSTWSRAPLPRPPPVRAIGTVLNSSATALRLPAALVEVVGRGADRGARPPLVRERAQDRRGVQVARVVGHEDHGRLQIVEDVAPRRAVARVEIHQRVEPERQQRVAQRPHAPAARPRDVHLGVLARELDAAVAQLLDLRNAVPELARADLAALDQALASLPHAVMYSGAAVRGFITLRNGPGDPRLPVLRPSRRGPVCSARPAGATSPTSSACRRRGRWPPTGRPVRGVPGRRCARRATPAAAEFACGKPRAFRRAPQLTGWIVVPVDREDFDGPKRYEPGRAAERRRDVPPPRQRAARLGPARLPALRAPGVTRAGRAAGATRSWARRWRGSLKQTGVMPTPTVCWCVHCWCCLCCLCCPCDVVLDALSARRAPGRPVAATTARRRRADPA